MSALRLASALLFSLVLAMPDAAAWERGSVQSFASLPPGSPNPEGITADSQGNIYVTGFGPTTPQGGGSVGRYAEKCRRSVTCGFRTTS